MKTIIGAIGAACALLCGMATGVRAEPNSPDVGQVLLLDNERLVEGDIHREGNRYRIRRELGESWIPADKVIRLCASREEAFQTLRARPTSAMSMRRGAWPAGAGCTDCWSKG